MSLAKDYDHFAPEYVDDPFGLWKELREKEPVSHSEKYGGFNVVTRYEDVDHAARDTETFSSADGAGIPSLPFVGLIPLDIDPPDHKKYRDILAPGLSIGAVEEREDEIRELVIRLIEPLTDQREFDAATELAVKVPPQATLEFIGFPPDTHEAMEEAINDITRLRGEETERIQEAGQQVMETVGALVQRRRDAERQADLLSDLIEAEFDGRPLEDQEIIRTLILLLFGAIDTTASAIAGSLYFLATHPEHQKALREAGSIPKPAIEELVRWVSPLQGLGRTVTTDTEFSGCPLHRGDRVLLMWGSANRDEAVFDNPDDVDFERKPNRHLAFGMGPHRCAGRHLGKLMLRVTLEEFLARVGEFELADPDGVTWLGGEARGIRALPLKVTG